jgi:hypothetical protein
MVLKYCIGFHLKKMRKQWKKAGFDQPGAGAVTPTSGKNHSLLWRNPETKAGNLVRPATI